MTIPRCSALNLSHNFFKDRIRSQSYASGGENGRRGTFNLAEEFADVDFKAVMPEGLVLGIL
jgi:hypothetical protein